MRITINPLTITTDSGDVVCNEAEVSVAVSNSVAIRIVPVGPDGFEYHNNAAGIVGDAAQTEIADFMTTLTTALITLINGRT